MVRNFLASFKDYPPSQRPSSFSIDHLAWRRSAATPGGATAAILTDLIRVSHVIRRVLLRQVAILDDVNPF